MATKEPTAAAASESKKDGSSKSNPPEMITVETSNKDDEGNDPTEQARTPKHANKTRDDDGEHTRTPEPKHNEASQQRPPYGQPRRSFDNNFPPPRPYEGRPLGGSGAFQPHEPRRQAPPSGEPYYRSGRPPVQVSPGGTNNEYYRGGYYNNANGPPGPPRGGPPPRVEAGYSHHGPPPHANDHPSYFDQRNGYGEYAGHPPAGYEGPGPHPPAGYRGQYPPPPSYPPQSYGGYPPGDSRANPPGWGTHPPPYHPGQHPQQQGQYPGGPPDGYQRPPASNVHDARYPAESHTGVNTFSRAVSSSFDRSVKSRTSEEKPPGTEESRGRKPTASPGAHAQDALMADDLSWNQLKQVHSVDDNAIKESMDKDNDDEKNDSHIQLKQAASNSSSLTNSPTEGVDKRHAFKEAAAVVAAAAAAVAAAAPSSLDSLASASSALEPIGTAKNKKAAPPPPSPGSESASLDLMKCSSGSSGLLHLPAHQRSMLNEDGFVLEGKRDRDEEREDMNTGEAGEPDDESRRAPSDFGEIKSSDGQPPQKRVRLQGESKTGEKKGSPISISCSPPVQSPGALKRRGSTTSQPLKPAAAHAKTGSYHESPQPMEGNYFDKPPSYSYSMDSAPSFPRDGGPRHRKQPNYPSLPPRPASSSSSTITPAMQVDRDQQDPSNQAVPCIPSWEIHAQDSFGGGSVGGGQGLLTNFSFQDYPMLPNSESNLGAYSAGDAGSSGNPPGHPSAHSNGQQSHHQPPPHHHAGSHPHLESRNQSFEGGHYHGGGSFQRNDSMDMSYGGRPAGPPPYSEGPRHHGHQGSFPPHAPSWGTAGSGGSYPHGPSNNHYGQYGGRMGPGAPGYPGGVMRNYSEDSAHRASPPPGPPGSRGHPGQRAPAGFQPPPEFAAPHNPQLSRRPPPAVYIMSSSQNGSHAPQSNRGSGVFSWSKDDDSRLTDIMKKYKNPRDWEPIANEHGMGKSAKECHERWIRYLKPGVRKGQWTDHEDAIVIETVGTSTEQPFTRWSDLAQRLPGRVGKQIRDRWVNHLNPNINHLPFSREDDMLLWDGHTKLGKRWVEISSKFFNCSRSENHIKNRWYSASFKKFITNEFGAEAYSGKPKNSKGGDSKNKKKSKQLEDPTISV